MDKKKIERESGLDFVRFLAVFSVIGAHYVLNCGYYRTDLKERGMVVFTVGRWFFMTCVPIFMILTGYLKINKKLSRSHYMELIPIMVGYGFIGTLNIFVSNYIYGGVYTWKSGGDELFTYRIAWYGGMYLCMMLVIQFFNILWKNLGKKQKQLLILFLLCITAVPSLIPWFFPSYWERLYPLTYYYIGAYIRDYSLKPARWKSAGIMFLVLLVETGGTYLTKMEGVFNWEFLGSIDNGYGSLPVCISAICLFLLFYRQFIPGKWVRRLLASVSQVSFYIYLFSSMIDSVIYWKMQDKWTNTSQFLTFFFVIVPLSFSLSYVCAVLFKHLFSPLLEPKKWFSISK